MEVAKRVAAMLEATMCERKLLPVKPSNKRTLKWLEGLGCVVAYKKRRTGPMTFHPTKFLESRGYDHGIRHHSALEAIFSYGSRPSGPRNRPFDWIHEGFVVRIRCAGSLRHKSLTHRMWMRESMMIWVPDSLAAKMLALNHIP